MSFSFFRRLIAGWSFACSGRAGRLLPLLRGELLAQAEQYPSVLNDGYLHIDRAVELIEGLKLPPEAPLVDVGAASGAVAQRLARAFPAATVYCFEPLEATYVQLVANVQANPRIVPRKTALGERPGSREMHVMRRETCSSLLAPAAGIQDPFFAASIHEVSREPISVSTLDEELAGLPAVNLLKLDVQGYELAVLQGGRRVLPNVNVVLLEMQNHGLYPQAPRYYELDAYLRGAGFTLFNIIPSIRQSQKLYEWDALYVNNRHAERLET